MNNEQKQRALAALGMWHSSNDDSLREYQAAEMMAALLQEMIDAPEPKSCGWIRAIDEAMVMHHLGVADIADDYEAAKKKLNTLLSLNQDIGEYFSAKAPAPSVLDADLVRDADRYRWLRDKCRSTGEHWGGRWSLVIEGPCPDGDESSGAIDKAIDAARKRQGASHD